MAVPHRLDRLLPGRVDHALQAEEGQARGDVLVIDGLHSFLYGLHGECEDPETPPGHGVHGRVYGGHVGIDPVPLMVQG